MPLPIKGSIQFFRPIRICRKDIRQFDQMVIQLTGIVRQKDGGSHIRPLAPLYANGQGDPHPIGRMLHKDSAIMNGCGILHQQHAQTNAVFGTFRARCP